LIGDGEVIFLLCFFLHFQKRSDRQILKIGGKIRAYNRNGCHFWFDWLIVVAKHLRNNLEFFGTPNREL
jgi:hypothetical protein